MAFFLKGYVSFSEYSTSSTAAPAPMPLAPQHQKTKRLLGAARGSTTQPFWTAQQTADSFQIFKNERNFGHFGASFQRQYVGNNVFFFQVSLSFYIFLKELFNLTISALKLLCCSYPRTKQHTHTEIFSGKTRNSHVQHTRPRYHQHHPPSHPVVMKLKWGRPRGWRDGVVLVSIGRQGIKIRNRDDLEELGVHCAPLKYPEDAKKS